MQPESSTTISSLINETMVHTHHHHLFVEQNPTTPTIN